MENFEEGNLTNKAPIFKVAYRILKHALNDLMSGECSEEELIEVVSKLSPENNEYFKPTDFVSTEKAMDILRLGKNRTKFFQLMKINNIKNRRINNMPVGFLKKEILDLKRKLYS